WRISGPSSAVLRRHSCRRPVHHYGKAETSMKDASKTPAARSAAVTGPGQRQRVGKTAEFIMQLVFLICGLLAVGFVLVISIYLIISGLPAIREVGLIDFLFGTTWNASQEQFGILA